MAEAIQKNIETGQVTPAPNTGFEPEILAFCCEH